VLWRKWQLNRLDLKFISAEDRGVKLGFQVKLRSLTKIEKNPSEASSGNYVEEAI